MKVLIATENRAKVQAVKEVFTQRFPQVEFFTAKYDSEVSDQPLSENEGIQGAINRALNAKKDQEEMDFYVGLEGYVDTNQFGMFLAGAVAIVDQNAEIGVGISAKMQMPNFMRQAIEAGRELGPLVQEMMQDENNQIRHTEGTGGILTDGLCSRMEEFKNGTKCALARFLTPHLFKK